MLKHRELVRNALRDEKTLAELEVQLQSLKQVGPSERPLGIDFRAITDKPIAPRKKYYHSWLAYRVDAGCGAALVRDRLSGLVFSEKELKALLPGSMLERLPLAKPTAGGIPLSYWFVALVDAQSVSLIPVGECEYSNRTSSTRTL